MRIELRFILLLLCFFLSGFAALLYETAWAREFAFVFGTSEFAVVSVLAAGAAVAARFVSRIQRPIFVYGLLELGIAASALAPRSAADTTTRRARLPIIFPPAQRRSRRIARDSHTEETDGPDEVLEASKNIVPK